MAEEVKKEEKVEEKPAEAPKAKEKVEEVKVEEKKEEVVAPEAPKAEEKLVSSEVEKPAPSGKYKELIKQIESLSVLELSELVKELEDRFGVSASAAPVAIAGAAPAGAEGGAEESASTTATLVLADSGAQKIAVIKALREINPDLGLKEAKDIADAAPKEIKKDMPREEAEEAKKKLEEAGAKVELK